ALGRRQPAAVASAKRRHAVRARGLRQDRGAQFRRLAIALAGAAQKLRFAESGGLPDEERYCREREQPLQRLGRNPHRPRVTRPLRTQLQCFIHPCVARSSPFPPRKADKNSRGTASGGELWIRTGAEKPYGYNWLHHLHILRTLPSGVNDRSVARSEKPLI